MKHFYTVTTTDAIGPLVSRYSFNTLADAIGHLRLDYGISEQLEAIEKRDSNEWHVTINGTQIVITKTSFPHAYSQVARQVLGIPEFIAEYDDQCSDELKPCLVYKVGESEFNIGCDESLYTLVFGNFTASSESLSEIEDHLLDQIVGSRDY